VATVPIMQLQPKSHEACQVPKSWSGSHFESDSDLSGARAGSWVDGFAWKGEPSPARGHSVNAVNERENGEAAYHMSSNALTEMASNFGQIWKEK
jgi:hypothetical protein